MRRGQKYPSEPLTRDEIVALCNANTNGALGCRNRAALYLLWHCGLRVSELLALRPCDVAADSVRVLRGKGGKSRTVGLGAEAAAVVGRWMDRRKALGIDARLPLICSLKGEALCPTAMRELMKRLARKAGIVKRVHPHALRHSFAADGCKTGTSNALIAECSWPFITSDD
jgi:site-specific recombinase XerD